jgi:hypothetical protein
MVKKITEDAYVFNIQAFRPEGGPWSASRLRNKQAIKQYFEGVHDPNRILFRFVMVKQRTNVLKVAICDLAASDKARYFNAVLTIGMPMASGNGSQYSMQTSYDGSVTGKFLDIVWQHTNHEVAHALFAAEELFAQLIQKDVPEYKQVLHPSIVKTHFDGYQREK